jgi:hypothetical protein
VTRLRERFGDVSHVGDDSLFGLLKKRGWTVYPDPFDGREQAGFTGGYIVQTHGSHRAEGIDAVQLEFGADYRKAANRARIAEDLATAIIQYLDLYVPEWKLKSTAEQDEAIK